MVGNRLNAHTALESKTGHEKLWEGRVLPSVHCFPSVFFFVVVVVLVVGCLFLFIIFFWVRLL